MIEVVVGQPIPLSLQVYDGNENLQVVATLFDTFGKQLFDQKLVHINQGLYLSFDLEMPDIPIIVAQYKTNKPDDYELVQDIFKSIPKPTPPEKMMIGEVIDKGQWDDEDIIIGEAHVDEEDEST